MKFSQREIKELLISTLALAVMFSRFNIDVFPITLFVVVLVFASHEILGHKLFAQHYGFDAEYRMWSSGIILGLLMALMGGFVFAAPGAVMISPISKKFAFTVGKMTKQQYGLIAASGAMVNIVIGLTMIGALYYYPLEILALTARVSFFLALFNMIPFGPLDGEKVMKWSWKVWGLITGIALIGYFIL
ncbi:MAG: hypothetical protein GOV02_01985 [Candidatus Aenigmarchaeota archaeon]|nr:hypothetical protein [Candidatus Aenigmarchaeota archaeon]